jgi:hypothetical protein
LAEGKRLQDTLKQIGTTVVPGIEEVLPSIASFKNSSLLSPAQVHLHFLQLLTGFISGISHACITACLFVCMFASKNLMLCRG